MSFFNGGPVPPLAAPELDDDDEDEDDEDEDEDDEDDEDDDLVPFDAAVVFGTPPPPPLPPLPPLPPFDMLWPKVARAAAAVFITIVCALSTSTSDVAGDPFLLRLLLVAN